MLAMAPDAFDAALAEARAHVEQVFDALLSDPARRTDAPVPKPATRSRSTTQGAPA
jgi:hypothetical protein